MTVYSRRAPKTNMMQAITQHSIAVKPSAYKSNFNEILPSIIHRGIFYSKNIPEEYLTLTTKYCFKRSQ